MQQFRISYWTLIIGYQRDFMFEMLTAFFDWDNGLCKYCSHYLPVAAS